MGNIISGPVPPYSNPPIQPQFYQPKVFYITAIGLGETTLITTSVDMDYVLGQEVRLLIPSKYGSIQLNEKTGFVIDIPSSNQVILDIFSVGVDAFIPSPTFVPFESQTPPQIVAIGDKNNGIISSTGRFNPTTNIPGAFINISPQ